MGGTYLSLNVGISQKTYLLLLKYESERLPDPTGGLTDADVVHLLIYATHTCIPPITPVLLHELFGFNRKPRKSLCLSVFLSYC